MNPTEQMIDMCTGLVPDETIEHQPMAAPRTTSAQRLAEKIRPTPKGKTDGR